MTLRVETKRHTLHRKKRPTEVPEKKQKTKTFELILYAFTPKREGRKEEGGKRRRKERERKDEPQ